MTAEHSSNECLSRIKITLKQNKGDLRRTYRVKSLGLFGSYIKGEERTSSDIDILVEFYEAPGLLDFIALEYHLGDLLGIKVDLVMKDALKPAIGERILREVVPV
ncbi:MAG: nucleotidyltransferase family protein [Actinomycetia bacterium]|nr:nucleotidyltransferase family protein [Actinomycetes bacterium]